MMLLTAGSYGAGNDNLSDLMLFATSVAVLPAWLIWADRISGTGTAFVLTCASVPKENVMDSHAMFLNCPAYMDNDGATRCGLPAEVDRWYILNSADGRWKAPRSGARAATFNGPIECLTVPERPAVSAVSASPPSPPTVRGAVPHL